VIETTPTLTLPLMGDGVRGAPYLPFADGRFRLALGLMPLPPADWIEIDGDLALHLAEKRALAASRLGAVFATSAEAEAPSAELLALLADHLPRHHGGVFRATGTVLRNLATGEDWDMAHPSLHPLDQSGRLVQEDFCLLLQQGGRYVLGAASLAAPARWRLADKMGKPLVTVHAPVPGYEEGLARPVDRLLETMKPDRLVWRLNWSIVDDPARFQPERVPSDAPVTAGQAGAMLWLRVERQTLRKLPATGAVVFTIRTHITRLDRAIETAPVAASLAAALRSMPDEMQAYKHIAPYATALLAWLDTRATGA
jgi:dimethylamine monooxygenase subunit A